MKSLIFALAILSFKTEACSIFAVSNGQNVFAANNEDDPPVDKNHPFVKDYLGAKVTFSPAGGQRHYGSMHYSFDDNYPQGGLNTAGLFYDINALPKMDPAKYPPSLIDHPGLPGAILIRMLETTGTVTEALALLHSYKLPGIEIGQVFIADRNGDAAVVGIGREGTVTETRKNGNFLLSTNFNLNNPQKNYPEPRFELANKLWRQDSSVSFNNVRHILSAIHFESTPATIYSQIYDLKRAEAMFYQFHDYTNGVKMNLANELQKRGASTVTIASLFDYQPYSVQLTQELVDSRKKTCRKNCL